MKRPHIFYLLIALLCILCIGIAAIYFDIKAKHVQSQELVTHILDEQAANHASIINVLESISHTGETQSTTPQCTGVETKTESEWSEDDCGQYEYFYERTWWSSDEGCSPPSGADTGPWRLVNTTFNHACG